jgi:hypothetical protein
MRSPIPTWTGSRARRCLEDANERTVVLVGRDAIAAAKAEYSFGTDKEPPKDAIRGLLMRELRIVTGIHFSPPGAASASLKKMGRGRLPVWQSGYGAY